MLQNSRNRQECTESLPSVPVLLDLWAGLGFFRRFLQKVLDAGYLNDDAK